MILNVNQLRSFYTAAKTGSISKAAQELMVTPPAITMQVKQLEEAVGISLLVREGNSIQPTRAGQELFKKAERIFQEIHETEAFLEDMSTGKLGELRIGCPEMPSTHPVPRLIAEFKKAYPGIKILVDQGPDAEIFKSFEDQRNELVVIRHRPNTGRLKTRVIGKEKLVLIASSSSTRAPGNEMSVRQLSEIPLILKGEGSATREVVLEYLRKFKVHPQIAMESSSVSVIKEIVRQDNGVAFIERTVVEAELDEGSLKIIRILEGSPVIEIGVAYRNRRELSPAAWAFLRLLEKSADLPFMR
ncbi:MAG: LysR family transcriptional regulator [Syntrophorhabdales bacterium]|jgi:DNA-binding transcriptional LysR family regulator